MKRSKNWIIVGLFWVIFANHAQAQSARFNGARVHDMCLQGDCIRGTQAAVGQLLLQKLPPLEFNSQLGAIAALLFGITHDADEDLVAQIAEAMRLLALYTSDAIQRESFISVSAQIADGGSAGFDLSQPFAVSPS